MVVPDKINIQGNRANQKFNNTMSVMLCRGATFVKKNSYLVVRVVSLSTAGLRVLTFHF